LVGLMDRMNLPPNTDVTERLYSMTLRQAGNFDNLYDDDEGFRDMIGLLQTLVQEYGGPFAGLVTPDQSPTRTVGGNAD